MRDAINDREVITLSEWEGPVLLAGRQLVPADRLIAERLSADKRLVIEEMRGGLRVSATSWIGVVRLQGLELRIVPKYAGDDLGVLRMLDYASGFNSLAQYDAMRTLQTEGRSLLDLLGWLLAERGHAIVRAGVLAEYVQREEDLPVLRGRLRILAQVRERYGRIDRLECTFDEHETDIVDNQVIAAAVDVARRVCTDPAVVSRLSTLNTLFQGICDASGLDPRSARATISYNRRNEHYRAAHGYAWLFLHHRGVDEVFASGGTESLVFLLDMNQLFEDFVTRLLYDMFEGTGVRVLAQRRDRSIVEHEDTRRPYAAVIPDLLLEWRQGSSRARLPIDAKYKLYDTRRLEPSDVYQAFFYGYAYHPASVETVPMTLLVYPSAVGGLKTSLRVKDAGGHATAKIRALGLNIPRALQAIEAHSIWSLDDLGEVRRIVRESREELAAS